MPWLISLDFTNGAVHCMNTKISKSVFFAKWSNADSLVELSSDNSFGLLIVLAPKFFDISNISSESELTHVS